MDENQYIKLTGLKENNLKNVSLLIPKKKITVFTGVSGSGKSSIVFDTISKEAGRQLNQTFTTFIQNRLPKYSRPDADSIENLSPAMVIDQKRLGGNARSTLGTITDIYAMLRLLFSRIGEPFIGYSHVFSFNDPQGMCPECEGLGKQIKPNIDKMIDQSKSLNEGAIQFPLFRVGSYYWKTFVLSDLFDNDKKLEDYTKHEWHQLLYGENIKIDLPSVWETRQDYEGVIVKFNRLYLKRDLSEHSKKTRKHVEDFTVSGACSNCGGTRLNQKVLSCKIHSYNIAELSAMELSDLSLFLKSLMDPVTKPIVDKMLASISHMNGMGLDYLTLNRETTTLSGGESQRIKMVRHLSSSLTDMIYIFDEPSIGLHPRDVENLNQMLNRIRDKGNTVIVVEHDRDVIEVADHIIDVGPEAGTQGGEIVYEGDLIGLMHSGTLTGQYMKVKPSLKEHVRHPRGYLVIDKATSHNLKGFGVRFPKHTLTVVTGVAGSGKSSLIHGELVPRFEDIVVIDQKAVSTSRRSNPATYTGIMDSIRTYFAKANHVSKSLFSFNSKGACPECGGNGVIYTDLAFMEGVQTRCETCQGKRFKDEVLQYKLGEKHIKDILDMTVNEALQFFQRTEVVPTLQALSDVGLAYMTLGQPLSTLSGGECQRIKLASELYKSGNIYVLDEPTTGLHMSDIGQLVSILNRLVDNGSTVIVIEHNMDVMKQADWLIDLGPSGGKKGGEIMFEGTPHDLVAKSNSLTAQYLKKDM
ncbi:ATP-binding cassette domain-containing protein [Gracilibacillus salitolerans]|uniref:UvrABC system protein A n=2 Tax=Gracilibacillus salitolerans TaxID=2663022 RepID=A0A5Q2TTX5_9BACI|nr:ATP-binding cassette domain-containing protein [Gracilibacillus salitolerans]